MTDNSHKELYMRCNDTDPWIVVKQICCGRD